MLIFALLISCTKDKPLAGSLELCLPDALQPTFDSEAPVVFSGDLVRFQLGNGDCHAEAVFQDGDTEYVIGYTQYGPEGIDPEQAVNGYIPQWEAAENVTVSIYAQNSFGTSYGLVVEDDDGILIALEEGHWGGALSDVALPFEVGKSENPIGTIEQECVIKTGYALTVGDEVMAPYANYDLSIEGMDYKFLSIAAMENSPGIKCAISDISDAFTWGLFRSEL